MRLLVFDFGVSCSCKETLRHGTEGASWQLERDVRSRARGSFAPPRRRSYPFPYAIPVPDIA
eukprot:1824581-Rhodomonas_salina.3